MRPGQQNKRGRGRNNSSGGGSSGGQNNSQSGNFNRKGGANPLTRTYDSSGPEVKIRGTAQHIAEKYTTLARDATSSGDRVMAENYLQHAEHYNRIIAAAQAQMQERFQRDERNDFSDRDNDNDGDDGDQMDDDNNNGNNGNDVQQNHNNNGRNNNGSQGSHASHGSNGNQSEHNGNRSNNGSNNQPRPVEIAGAGPQPIIEDKPVPVAASAEPASEDGEPREKPLPRRRAAARPRRQPRVAQGGDEAAPESGDKAAADTGDAPVLATVVTD